LHEEKYLYLGACHSVWNFLETQVNHHWGGVACARQGDFDTCCLVFLSESVMWTCLGYFQINCTILHFRVELGTCIILSIYDLNYGKFYDYFVNVCWTDGLLRMIVVIIIVFLLIIVFWCLLIFYNKLIFSIFVPCDWCLWWSRTFVRGSRWAAAGDLEGSLLLEPLSRCHNVGIYFGGELCFVMNSPLIGSLNLFYWACKSQV